MRELDDVLSEHPDLPVLDADLIVLGAGMAGFTTAGRAAERGLRVHLIEKADRPGGSAMLSEGFVWTMASLQELVEEDPAGDDALGQVLINSFPERIEWLRSLQVEMGPKVRILRGSGHQINVKQYFDRCAAMVQAAEGHVLPAVSSVDPFVAGGRFAGVIAHRGAEDAILRASAICLATGGFQANPELTKKYITPNVGRVRLRSNRESTGDGMAIGLQFGAQLTTESMSTFYGHLFPSPLPPIDPTPSDYTLLSQFHSEQGVLLNRHGRRFTDESRMDHENAIAVMEAEGSMAYLVIDERVRREVVLRPFAPGLETGVDKMAYAETLGARYASADSLPALAEKMAEWSVPTHEVVASVERYNEAIRGDTVDRLRPPRQRFRFPLDEPPFAALEVGAAITFTYGGLACDSACRVLNEQSRPIPGLLAAGADMGGVYRRGYTGGLARGLVFGYQAAETAVTVAKSLL
jgi:succinate dehydrogenase/fumarate reductase flavoprotein subunit